MAWLSPTLQVKWGPYFRPEPAEQLQIVQLVQAALGGAPGAKPLITPRIGIEKIQDFFGIENVDAVLDELEKQAEEQAQNELDAATAALEAQGGAGGAGQNSKGDAVAPNGGGGRPPSGKVNAR